jgi:hypothetical protein
MGGSKTPGQVTVSLPSGQSSEHQEKLHTDTAVPPLVSIPRLAERQQERALLEGRVLSQETLTTDIVEDLLHVKFNAIPCSHRVHISMIDRNSKIS